MIMMMVWCREEENDDNEEEVHCDNDDMKVQILCFWTISIVLSLSKSRPVYFSKHNVSETGFCLRLQVRPIQLGPIDRASPYLRTFLLARKVILEEQ
jgi:hypothetical protein